MRAGPPKALEAVVGILIPPACREEVLGDLYERYTDTWHYLADATFVVPCVIASRIRRTTDPQVCLMEAFVMYLSFLAAAWLLDPAVLDAPRGLLQLAIPAFVALVALRLEDAYASPGKRSPLRPIRDALLGVAFAVLSQAVLWTADRELLLPRWILISGGGLSVLLVSAVRMLFAPGDDRPRGAT